MNGTPKHLTSAARLTPNMKMVAELNAIITASDPAFDHDIHRMCNLRNRILLKEAVLFGLATREQIEAMSRQQQDALMMRVYDLPVQQAAFKDRHAHRCLTLIEGGR